MQLHTFNYTLKALHIAKPLSTCICTYEHTPAPSTVHMSYQLLLSQAKSTKKKAQTNEVAIAVNEALHKTNNKKHQHYMRTGEIVSTSNSTEGKKGR